MSAEEPPKKFNRKRKKNFIHKAKKYAKQGHFGLGSKIDRETYDFFLNSLETFKQGFKSDEAKAEFINSVFKQTTDREIECSCNQVGSRLIESLLPFASDAVLETYMQKFGEDVRPLSKDKFGSFVLQTLVSISSKKALNSDNPKQLYYKQFTLKISKFLLNNLEDYVWDNTGNQVIRVCLYSLLQMPLESKQKPLNNSITIPTESPADLPEEYIEVVTEFAERLILWPQFNDMCASELTSGLIQVILKVLKKADNSKMLKKYLEKLLNENFLKDNNNPEKLPSCFLSTSLLMLLEVCLQVAGKKRLKVICENLFAGRMVQLACLRSTNFAVQNVLTHCTDKEQFETFFDELSDHLGEVIQAGHPGVVLALGQGCKRLSTKQGAFMQALMKALKCEEPEERQQHFVLCLSRLKAFNVQEATSNENLAKEKLNLQGTLIVQLLLDFNKPIKVVNSMLSMDVTDLCNLLCNSMGCHITDSYTQSKFVGEKSREKLVRALRGTYQTLAGSKYGSRTFESLWKAANIKAKLQIMDELADKDKLWSQSGCGKIIACKVNLNLFKRNKESWKTSIDQIAKQEVA